MECCQPGTGKHGIGSHLASLGGCCCNGFPRRFYTAKEEQEALEAYRDELKKELAGVEEHLNQIKKK